MLLLIIHLLFSKMESVAASSGQVASVLVKLWFLFPWFLFPASFTLLYFLLFYFHHFLTGILCHFVGRIHTCAHAHIHAPLTQFYRRFPCRSRVWNISAAHKNKKSSSSSSCWFANASAHKKINIESKNLLFLGLILYFY